MRKQGEEFLKERIKLNDKKIKSEYVNYIKSKETVKRDSKKVKNSLKKTIIPMVSILLGVAFYLGTLLVTVIFSRRQSKLTVFNKESISYSLEYGEEEENTIYKQLFKTNRPERKVTIKSYGNWDDSQKRSVKVYDMSEFNYYSLKDYLSVPLDNLDYKEIIESKDEVDKKYQDREGYNAIVSDIYKYDGEDISVPTYACFQSVLGILAIIFDIICEKDLNELGLGVYSKLNEVKESLEQLKRAGKLRKADVRKLKKHTLELVKLVEKNKVLREKLEEKIRKHNANASNDKINNNEKVKRL